MCQNCLNIIQTFDALYQMCVENIGKKSVPNLLVGNSTEPKPSEDNEIVHLQLQKTSNDSVVLKTVTEAERAVNGISKNKDSPVVLNGWTTKKMFEFVKHPNLIEKEHKNKDNSGG